MYTDEKFEEISFDSSVAHQEAVSAWKTITRELSRLGSEASAATREAYCSDDAGRIGVSKSQNRFYPFEIDLIDF